MLDLLLLDIMMITVGAIGIIVGSITDIQRREVADWVNLSLIFAGLGIRGVFALHTGEWIHLALSVVSCMIMFAIGAIMYYSGQWGGGDAKMLAGIGALFGTYSPSLLNPEFGSLPVTFGLDPYTTVLFPIWFFANTMIAGAIYGVVWSAVGAALHWKKVKAAFLEQKQTPKAVVIISYSLAGLAIAGTAWFALQRDIQLSILLGVLALMAIWYRYIKQGGKSCRSWHHA